MSLAIYMKPTNYCNIGCEHCYLTEETRADKRVMTDETLVKTAELAKNLAQKERHDSIHFIWHGGEPMVLSPDFYERASSIIDETIGKDSYTQSIQTSLIPYREEWKKLLHNRFSANIGTSIDFTQRYVKGSSENYIDLWLKKVAMAREHGMFVIPGMVPTRHEVKKAGQIVDWFVEHDFDMFNVDRYSEYGTHTIDWPSNKQHSEFLIGLFDRIIERMKAGQNVPVVNVIVSGIRGVLFSQPGDRWGTQCQRSFLVVEPDGSLNTCPDRASHEEGFSNAHDGAEAFQNSQGRRNWIRIQNITHKKDHCHSCEFNSWCQSGCPITPNGPSDGQQECSGYKTFLLHVKELAENPEIRALMMDYIDTGFEPIIAKQSILEIDDEH